MELLIRLANVFVVTIRDVLPIAIIVIGTQWFVIRKPLPYARKLLVGFFYVVLGMALFLIGLEMALFPLGKLMANQLTDPAFIQQSISHPSALDPTSPLVHWRDYLWVYLFAAAIGFSTTIAEPSLIAVALKANEVSGGAVDAWGLRIAVGIGVAIGLALGSFRIVTGLPLQNFIIIGYAVVMLQTLFAPRLIIALAYDSGGVTTSTVTVPLVTALGLGLASTVPGRSPLLDGFGLIAFASLFPIISVIGYAQFAQWRALRAQRLTSKEGE